MTSDHAAAHGGNERLPLYAIVLLVVCYLAAAAAGLPQHGTELITGAAGAHDAAHAADHIAETSTTHDAATAHPENAAHHDVAGHDTAADHGHGAAHHEPPQPPGFIWVTPFALLLGAIAVLPLIPATEHWWESNKNRFLVAATLAAVTLVYYLTAHHYPIERHFLGHGLIEPASTGLSFNVAWVIFQNAIFGEFVPFIVLLFSLYTISGGIRISGDLRATPHVNATFIAIGGLLASFIGTTGAAMLLIRPLLDTNDERKHVRHTVIFFIFVVCNTGGCLLPIGDPPLFLGYLLGVDFLWTLNLWPQWLTVNCLLIAIYYAWDRVYAYPKESKSDVAIDTATATRIRISGLGLGSVWLVGVILAVALLDPSKPFPGTDWHPWLFLREIVQLSMVACSLYFTSTAIRKQNNFNYHAIIEVAALFFGIFICMQPALQILGVYGSELGIDTPQKFFWATGGLSAVLDNAPTYVVFFKTAQTLPPGSAELVAGVATDLLVAISLGAVFMGAMTYIGNGPNFMVKAIAEKSNVRMPSFFGYMLYSCTVLLPILALTVWLFE